MSSWVYGQKKVRKKFNKEAYEKYWKGREKEEGQTEKVDEEEIKEHIIKVLSKNRKV